MTRRLTLLALLLAASTVVAAKVGGAAVPVSGILVDSQGAPVPGATILLFKRFTTVSEEGMQMLAQATTDSRGRFSFGSIDPDATPKGLPDYLLLTKSKPAVSYAVTTGANQSRTVVSVSTATQRGKDDAVQSVSLTITIR